MYTKVNLDTRDKILVGSVHPMTYPQTAKGEGPITDRVQKSLEDDFFSAIEISWIKNSSEKKSSQTSGSKSCGGGFLWGTSGTVVSFEVRPLAGETPEIVIANTKRVFSEAWVRAFC